MGEGDPPGSIDLDDAGHLRGPVRVAVGVAPNRQGLRRRPQECALAVQWQPAQPPDQQLPQVVGDRRRGDAGRVGRRLQHRPPDLNGEQGVAGGRADDPRQQRAAKLVVQPRPDNPTQHRCGEAVKGDDRRAVLRQFPQPRPVSTGGVHPQRRE
jgi:hypothetical protein